MFSTPSRKALLVTVIAVGAAYAISFSTRLFFGQPITLINWVMCFVIPVVVSVPISYWIFRQSDLLAEANRQLAERASHDAMTKLLNRETFLGRLDNAATSDAAFALLIVDADNFKSINDGFGHAEGDRALILIADALRASCRNQDILGRVGGEEFAALLFGVSTEVEGKALAERMRRAVEAIPWLTINGRKRRLTVSIGGAVWRTGVTPPNILREADEQLYRAKRRGRNCIAFRESPVTIAPLKIANSSEMAGTT